MSKLFLSVFSLAWFFFSPLSGQTVKRVYGSVVDAVSGEALPMATVYNVNAKQGTVTNAYGYYSIPCAQGAVTVDVSYLGYRRTVLELMVVNDTLVTIPLHPGVELKELVVTGRKSQNFISSPTIGSLQLPLQSLMLAPSFLGENDLVAALKFLPGVSAGREGAAELNVRGGVYDQNLILLDGSPVYNLNHAFGLVSMFNPSVIKNVSLYKEGISAKYGGRLSSVLDVSVREGHKTKMKGNYSVSTIALGATIEGPVIKEKASYLLSVRRTWPDLLVTGIASSVQDGKYVPGIYFMDINGKVNFKINDKQHLYLSYYTGQDKLFLRVKEEAQRLQASQGWGNHIATLRWHKMIRSDKFLELSGHYSSYYDFDEIRIEEGGKVQEMNKRRSDISDYGVKAHFDWGINDRHRLLFGAEGSLKSFVPSSLKRINQGEMSYEKAGDMMQQSIAAYVSDEVSFQNTKVTLGLRMAAFGKGDFEYFSVEPRVAFLHQLNERLWLKSGAMFNSQPMYALRKSSNGMPGYVWVPASGVLKPQSARQGSLGLHFQMSSHLTFDVEGYYKSISNLAGNYHYPVSVYSAQEWEQIISQGKGEAMGIELVAEYNSDKIHAQLSYDLGRAQSSFASINGGGWFPFDYDMRHDLATTASWEMFSNKKRKGTLSGSFALHSGAPLTMPTNSVSSVTPLTSSDIFSSNFNTLDTYSTPNNWKMPLYHRLDLGFNLEKPRKWGSSTWSFGLINAYNQQNTYMVFYDADKEAYRKFVLFPIMPFVGFKRTF
jgi:outer membrane receptor for ferrienterochelin and colicin